MFGQITVEPLFTSSRAIAPIEKRIACVEARRTLAILHPSLNHVLMCIFASRVKLIGKKLFRPLDHLRGLVHYFLN